MNSRLRSAGIASSKQQMTTEKLLIVIGAKDGGTGVYSFATLHLTLYSLYFCIGLHELLRVHQEKRTLEQASAPSNLTIQIAVGFQKNVGKVLKIYEVYKSISEVRIFCRVFKTVIKRLSEQNIFPL